MTDDNDNTFEDTPGELERLEAIIDKAAALRSPRQQSEVRLVGEPDDVAALLMGLAKARINFAPIGKPATGRMGNQTYQYAPLPELVKATAAPLAAENVVVLQFLTGAPDEEQRLTTWVTNGRARIESVLVFPGVPLTDSGQVKAWGALTTYLRRYAYQAILQLDGDADADDPAGDLAGKRQPPALEAARGVGPHDASPFPPRNTQRRSEPPPKPQPRQQPKAPQNGSLVPNYTKPKEGFAGRLAENRKAPAPEPPPGLPPLWDEEPPNDPNLSMLPEEQLLPNHGDRATAPAIEPQKPRDAKGSTVDPAKAEQFMKLAKRLGLAGPKLVTWMERRINKTDPKNVTDTDLDFLIESATEELAAG